jgi:hypothetical protein
MSKYAGLGTYLRAQVGADVPMTFSEIEAVTGTPLPPKAQHSRAWWSNNPSNNVMTKVWRDAGFESAQVDMAGRKLVFRRIRASGMEYEAEKDEGKRQGRHPLIGSMKGTFWIDPTWDLTKPTMSDEEIADMEANIHRTADMVEAGASGMSEAARNYEPEPEKKRGRHPAFGALKGTFWIDPDWDLTKPTMSDEELDEMEANFHRTADLIDAGFSRKPR